MGDGGRGPGRSLRVSDGIAAAVNHGTSSPLPYDQAVLGEGQSLYSISATLCQQGCESGSSRMRPGRYRDRS